MIAQQNTIAFRVRQTCDEVPPFVLAGVLGIAWSFCAAPESTSVCCASKGHADFLTMNAYEQLDANNSAGANISNARLTTISPSMDRPSNSIPGHCMRFATSCLFPCSGTGYDVLVGSVLGAASSVVFHRVEPFLVVRVWMEGDDGDTHVCRCEWRGGMAVMEMVTHVGTCGRSTMA